MLKWPLIKGISNKVKNWSRKARAGLPQRGTIKPGPVPAQGKPQAGKARHERSGDLRQCPEGASASLIRRRPKADGQKKPPGKQAGSAASGKAPSAKRL